MITPKDIQSFYNSNISNDLLITTDGSSEDTAMIGTLIEDSYNELEVLKKLLPENTIDLYAKVLTLVALLDRLGIDKSAFEGLNDRADYIRKMVFENLMNSNNENTIVKKSKVSIVRNDDNNIITDDFIDRFGS